MKSVLNHPGNGWISTTVCKGSEKTEINIKKKKKKETPN